MFIDTTINITDKNRKLIKDYAFKLKITKSQLIVKLLTMYYEDNKNNCKLFKRIKYQKISNDEKWGQMHIWLNNGFYEKCLDMRKFHKLSLSNIVSVALKLYIHLISQKQNNVIHDSYLILKSNEKNSSFIITFTNYPDKTTLNMLYNIFELT